MAAVFLQGFLLGGGLIIAIGAQNALILRQGLLREHVFVLCLIAALSDALLLTLAIIGVTALVVAVPALQTILLLGGGLFLFAYGALALKRAISPDVLDASSGGGQSLRSLVLTLLAFTYLNPHVYLDMVIVAGIAGQFEMAPRIYFALGVICASFVWFFSLGYGARLLAPPFRKPSAWRVLDCLIAFIMFALAISLLSKLL